MMYWSLRLILACIASKASLASSSLRLKSSDLYRNKNCEKSLDIMTASEAIDYLPFSNILFLE